MNFSAKFQGSPLNNCLDISAYVNLMVAPQKKFSYYKKTPAHIG